MVHEVTMMRTPKKCPARLIGVALLVSVSVSCGDDGRRDDQPTDRTADLRIAVGTDDAPDLSTATLAIRADGVATGTGYLAEPAAATRAAELLGDAAAAQRLVEGEPDDQACTEIYGGPDIATITGTLRGQSIDTAFHRSNGCGIADWDIFVPLIGPALEDTYTDPAQPIGATRQGRFRIVLASNATTGFSWMLRSGPDELVRFVERTYQTPSDGLVGAGGYDIFTFEAVAPGAVTLTFDYMRSFETAPPTQTQSFAVTVAP
jgi:predicted secreted protein